MENTAVCDYCRPIGENLLITWDAKGIPLQKTSCVFFFNFFLRSHKCAYPTDIELSSDRGF